MRDIHKFDVVVPRMVHYILSEEGIKKSNEVGFVKFVQDRADEIGVSFYFLVHRVLRAI